jgi:hypothetical protein
MDKGRMTQVNYNIEQAERGTTKAEFRFVPDTLSKDFEQPAKLVVEIPDEDKRMAAGELLKKMMRDLLVPGRGAMEGAQSPPPPLPVDDGATDRSWSEMRGGEEALQQPRQAEMDPVEADVRVSAMINPKVATNWRWGNQPRLQGRCRCQRQRRPTGSCQYAGRTPRSSWMLYAA